jgi:hypothetical protein
MSIAKKAIQGRIISVQPRIRLIRSFNERSHNYLGYSFCIEGKLGGQKGIFLIGVGKAVQAKRGFQAGGLISGECLSVPDPRLEPWISTKYRN